MFFFFFFFFQAEDGIRDGTVTGVQTCALPICVNVAARIEALAAPGEICVSASVREQIGEKLPIGFADLGEHGVKNIARPVRVYRVEKRAEPRTDPADDEVTAPLALPDRPSIAVLPFANMSGDPEQDYFVDGMVEDIITGLSRIKWLLVIARNSI